MNAPVALHAVAEAAEGMRDRLSAAEIARRLGCATSSVTRGERAESAVITWAAQELLVLAREDEVLREAVIGYLQGHVAPTGDADQVDSALVQEIGCSAEVQQLVVRARADGRTSQQEVAMVRKALLDRQKADERLLRNLQADAKRGGGL